MTLTWALVAVALLVLPTAGRRVSKAADGRPSPGVVAAALAGLAAACVALLGVRTGLLVAAVACPATGFGLHRLTRLTGHDRLSVADPAVPLVLDLAAAALRAGRPPAAAISAAAPAAPDAVRIAFDRVAGLLRLGADAAQAWSVLPRDGPLGPVAVVAVRSASSGARLAVAFERLAAELRAETTTAAAARAQRAGVLSMAPLGACFLPSFVLLGVVPVIVGMARTALGSVP